MASVIVAYATATHITDERGVEPLRAVEAASAKTGRLIGIISPSVEDAWMSGRVPTETDVKGIDHPGNTYLEPLFYATTSSSLDEVPTGRCYYLAVQQGAKFDADRVSGLLRVCFQGSDPTPVSLAGASASTT